MIPLPITLIIISCTAAGIGLILNDRGNLRGYDEFQFRCGLIFIGIALLYLFAGLST
ncbi:MAG: hypothetical protein PVF58_14230 [Candidatus Methanofastidiosia archaeon]